MDKIGFFLFIACLVRSCQSNYTVVVVEYSPKLTTNENIKKYQSFIETAATRYPLDVIIFPEGTLTMTSEGSLVPHPDDKVTPYRNETYRKYTAIRAMSEAAARHKVYLAVNLREREDCKNGTDDCPDCGYFIYNTNVAFDRNGTVIARTVLKSKPEIYYPTLPFLLLYDDPNVRTVYPLFGMLVKMVSVYQQLITYGFTQEIMLTYNSRKKVWVNPRIHEPKITRLIMNLLKTIPAGDIPRLRYRKYNLYEQNVNKPKTAELSTFTTDFNVTFGMIICFDILFKSPSIDLVREKNVKNIIFSSFWFGELPFLTAVQMQVGWAYALNVNLFASGANKPWIGSTGSGIYSRKHKQSYMVEKEMDVFIMREFSEVVDGKKSGVENRGLKLKENHSVGISSGKEVNSTVGKFNEIICYKELCCRFNLRYRKSNSANDGNYTYRAVVFNDSKSFGVGGDHVESYCALLLCTNGNCAKKPPSGNYPLVFDEIRIDGDFQRENTLQMPNTLVWTGDRSEITLLDTLEYGDYLFERKPANVTGADNVSIELKKEGVGKVIAFGIYGRKFNS